MFKVLSEDWFLAHRTKDPKKAVRELELWIKKNKNLSSEVEEDVALYIKEVLRLVTGYDKQVHHY